MPWLGETNNHGVLLLAAQLIEPPPLLARVNGRMVLVPTTSAPMAIGVVSISRCAGWVGPSPVICKLALAVERVLTSSATIKWKPGPQVESIPSEKVALPCASVVIDELPLIEIGSWISWVNATRVEGEKCLSVTCTVLPGEAALEESARVGNTPVP